jgi:hypothetical protein
VFALSLGTTVALGGMLTLSTCGVTHNNTVLYVGTGCPSWDRPFGCLMGSNDATSSCTANPLASTITLTVTQRNYFIQLGGVDGQNVRSSVRWTYSMPTRTSTGTGTRSRSRVSTRSRSRKPN